MWQTKLHNNKIPACVYFPKWGQTLSTHTHTFNYFTSSFLSFTFCNCLCCCLATDLILKYFYSFHETSHHFVHEVSERCCPDTQTNMFIGMWVMILHAAALMAMFIPWFSECFTRFNVLNTILFVIWLPFSV